MGAGRSLVFSTLLGCAPLLAQTPGDVPASPRPLVFASDADYPPITYLESGTAKGLAVDLVAAMSRELGRPIEIRLMDWGVAQDMLRRGEVDAVFPMSITEERKAEFTFSAPLLTIDYSIFARDDRPGIDSLSALRGLRVGVTPGGLPRQLLQGDSSLAIVEISDSLNGFRKIAAHEIDAVVADRWVGVYLLAKHGLDSVPRSRWWFRTSARGRLTARRHEDAPDRV